MRKEDAPNQRHRGLWLCSLADELYLSPSDHIHLHLELQVFPSLHPLSTSMVTSYLSHCMISSLMPKHQLFLWKAEPE